MRNVCVSGAGNCLSAIVLREGNFRFVADILTSSFNNKFYTVLIFVQKSKFVKSKKADLLIIIVTKVTISGCYT